MAAQSTTLLYLIFKYIISKLIVQHIISHGETELFTIDSPVTYRTNELPWDVWKAACVRPHGHK